MKERPAWLKKYQAGLFIFENRSLLIMIDPGQAD
jgi:hypothetical protein